MQMARFVKQLRRVQAYKQSVLRPSANVVAMEARSQLWHAVIEAPGFKPSFKSWWVHRPVQPSSGSLPFPVAPPSLEVAESLFTDFQANIEFMERRLSSARHGLAKARRADNCASFQGFERGALCPSGVPG